MTAIIAAFMMSGAAVAMEKGAVRNVMTVPATNILDKLISLVKGYTRKLESAESIAELEEVYAGLKSALDTFADNNAEEIAAFDENISAEKEKRYKATLDAAVKQFEKVLEKKAMQLLRE